MDPRGRPFDGKVTIGGTGSHGAKRKAIDDGLSLRSEPLGSSSEDGADDDAFHDRKKIADEEVPPPVQSGVQMQTYPPAGVRDPNHGHSYVDM